MTGRTDQFKSIFLSLLMVLSVIAIGSAGFAGSAAANQAQGISVEIGGSDTANVSAGNTTDIGDINIQDVSGTGGALNGEIVLNLPSGVTVNQSQSTNIAAFANKSSNPPQPTIGSNGGSITVNLSSGTSANELIEIVNVVVDVDSGADASLNGEVSRIDLSTKAGSTTAKLSGFDIYKPSLTDTGPFTLPAASTGQPVSFNINTTTAEGQIGNNTDIVLSVPSSSGVTFNTSLNTSSLTDGTNVDNDQATVSQNEVRIPTSSSFSGGENLSIGGLSVNVSSTASDTNLTASVTANNPTGTVSVENNQSSGSAIQIQKPTVTATSQEIAVGADGQGYTSGVNITSTGADSIGQDTNVTLRLNRSNDVSFDTTDNSVAVSWYNRSGYNVSDDLGTLSATVNKNNITANTSTIVNSSSTDGVVNVTGFSLNASATSANGTNVGFLADTQSQTGGTEVTTDVSSGNETVLRTPSVDFAGSTINVDNDGEVQDPIDDINVTDVTGNNLGPNENVTVALDSASGVTFDQSASVNASLNDSTGSVVTSLTPQVNTNNITVNVTQDPTSGQLVNFSNIQVNTSSGATNVTPSITTNTGNNSVGVTAPNQITISGANADIIAADGNVSDGTSVFNDGQDVTNSSTAVTETVTGAVRVKNGGPFGGAKVNLSITQTPNGSSGASLNTSQVITNSSGVAEFNFTAGDVAKDYKVNATIAGTSGAGQAGVNITYEVQPGSVSSVSVTPIENGLASGTGNTTNASLYVNATDSLGNPVSATAPVDLTAQNAGIGEIVAFDDWDGEDGINDSSDTSRDNISDGTFDIDSDDGSSVIIIDNNQVEDVTITADVNGNIDSGTVTFFDQVNQINVTLNQTNAVTDETVQASATVAESGGRTISVPDIAVDLDERSTSNTSLSSITVDTNNSGVATTTFTADSQGTATIRARNNLKAGTASLTISQPTLSASTNVSSVTVGSQTNVLSTVTYANNGSAVNGATVNVTGAGVSVADQTTNANGNATFSVNASSAGTITVNATKANTNAGQTTISAQQPTQPASFTVSNVTPDGANVTQGDLVNVSADLENTGGQAGAQTVEFRLDSDTNGTLEADEELANKSVQLDAGNTTTVNFTNIDTSVLPNSTVTYDHGVFSQNDSATATITVEAQQPSQQPAGPGDLTGDGNVSTDPNGDGQFEDINGDGQANLQDLQPFFDVVRPGTSAPSTPSFFDYNNDGNATLQDLQPYFDEVRPGGSLTPPAP